MDETTELHEQMHPGKKHIIDTLSMAVDGYEKLKPGVISKPLHRVIITWTHKDKETIENITYVTYSGRGANFGFEDKPQFMELHGTSGTPVDIIRLDKNIDRVQIVATGDSVPA